MLGCTGDKRAGALSVTNQADASVGGRVEYLSPDGASTLSGTLNARQVKAGLTAC